MKVFVLLFFRERVENTSAPGEMQVAIQNLVPDTKYTFRVVASNANGPGESSSPLTVATQPEGKTPQTHKHTRTSVAVRLLCSQCGCSALALH